MRRKVRIRQHTFLHAPMSTGVAGIADETSMTGDSPATAPSQEPLPLTITSRSHDPAGSILTVLCRGKRFFIVVQASNLAQTAFLTQYLALIQARSPSPSTSSSDPHPAGSSASAISDWMLDPCLPHFRRLAPRPASDAQHTLHQHLYPTTFRLELIGASRLMAHCAGSGTTGPGPGEWIENMCSPRFPGTPRFRASEVVVLDNVGDGDRRVSRQKKVKLMDGRMCRFGPVASGVGFVREVGVLRTIERAGLSAGARTSRLVGIVVSDDERMILGIVTAWIEALGSLDSVELRGWVKCHAGWKRQVEETVEELHRHSVTWGDVNPGNIIVDEEENAWVTGFGGGTREEHVTRELYSTEEGDLRGIEKVFERLSVASGKARCDAENILEGWA